MTSPPTDLIAAARSRIQRGQEFSALDLLRGAIKQQPPLGDRWAEVMQLCEQLGDEDGAAEAARLHGAHAPADPRRSLLYIDKLSRIGEAGHALALCQQMLEQRSSDPAVLYMTGVLASRFGRFDEAEHALRAALNVKPDLADAWVQIGAFRSFADRPNDVSAIRALVSSQSGGAKIAALFALGKAYDDLGEHALAFETWDKANSELLRVRPFDPRAMKHLQSACADFTDDIPQAEPATRGTGPAPIFIVGAPRTGTTLTEHILSAHPDIYPLGESLISRVATWPVRHLQPRDFATAKKTFGPSLWQIMGTAYRNLAGKRAGGTMRVTDKAAMLHLFVGVLATSMPSARFVWIRRSPEAAALSAFRTYFTSGNAWSGTIPTALSYLNAHNKLMQDWSERLGERLLAITYEDLVAQPKTLIPALIEFSGLAPNDAP